MSTTLYQHNGITLTQCANGTQTDCSNKGTRLELYANIGTICTPREAMILAGKLTQWATSPGAQHE